MTLILTSGNKRGMLLYVLALKNLKKSFIYILFNALE